jgi:hypothetical protein
VPRDVLSISELAIASPGDGAAAKATSSATHPAQPEGAAAPSHRSTILAGNVHLATPSRKIRLGRRSYRSRYVPGPLRATVTGSWWALTGSAADLWRTTPPNGMLRGHGSGRSLRRTRQLRPGAGRARRSAEPARSSDRGCGHVRLDAGRDRRPDWVSRRSGAADLAGRGDQRRRDRLTRLRWPARVQATDSVDEPAEQRTNRDGSVMSCYGFRRLGPRPRTPLRPGGPGPAYAAPIDVAEG